MEISPTLYPEETQRFVTLAQFAARQAGYDFALPATVEQLFEPCIHWRVLAAEQNGVQTCVLLEAGGQVLNVDLRPVAIPAKKSLWKRLFGG